MIFIMSLGDLSHRRRMYLKVLLRPNKIDYMKKILLCIGFVFVTGISLAQDTLAVKIKNLTVAQNKIIQNELKGCKILYTCIPAGIVLLQKSISTEELKMRISTILIKEDILVELKFIENYSVELAEKECSSFRKID